MVEWPYLCFPSKKDVPAFNGSVILHDTCVFFACPVKCKPIEKFEVPLFRKIALPFYELLFQARDSVDA